MARWGVVCWVVDQLSKRPSLGDAEVWPQFPGDKDDPRVLIWVENITGSLQIPVATGMDSRHERDDQWSFRVTARVIGPNALNAAHGMRACGDRLFAVMAEVEDLLADDPGLGDFPSVVDAEVTSADQFVIPTETEFIGVGSLTVSVHSRLD